jgi:peroxiredoxin
MPQLVDLHAKYKDRGVVVVGVSVDDTADEARAFAKEFSATYPMLLGRDRSSALQALGYTGAVPMTLFIRPDGTINERVLGIATTASMERRILALLDQD